MGCDIHAYVEWKHLDDQWWQWGGPVWLERDYVMFGTMASGVRVPPDALGHTYEQRGIPADADAQTREEWAEGGCHSPSWLTVDEYVKALGSADLSRMRLRHNEGSRMPFERHGKTWDALAAALLALGPESRVVFWFDN